MDIENRTKIKFTNEQYGKLNYIFSKKVERKKDLGMEQSEMIAERLVQRLLCAIGNIDSRFASKYLICLDNNTAHNDGIAKSRNLEYLIRLDVLSTPVLYHTDKRPKCEAVECEIDGETPGFGRLYLKDTTAKIWSDFINSSGYLRRDKIQEKFVELLAMAASSTCPNTPLEVDDSISCGAPGKVMDPYVLTEILKLPADQQVFYGASVNLERYPEPRDFRLAIVDEPSGVKLRIGFLSPTLAGNDIEVHLLLAVAFEQWPRTSNFPNRIPLEHPECLLMYQAAETGMYFVACGIHSASWQIWVPAAESLLINHHGPTSTVNIVMETLQCILHEIYINNEDVTSKSIWNLLNSYVLRSLLWYYMEDEEASPVQLVQNWTLRTTSKHVVHLLQTLITSIRQQNFPCYFFPNHNLLNNPGYILQDDYLLVANQIQNYMHELYELSNCHVDSEEYVNMKKYEDADCALIEKWKDVICGLIPPQATRSSRFSFAASKSRQEIAHTQYTNRQLDYIGLLLKHMLVVKKLIMQSSYEDDDQIFSIKEAPIEDVIFLLVTIMEQVWKSRINTKNSKQTLKSKSRSNFDAATTKLVESVRKNKELCQFDFTDDIILVQTVLRWLYKGLDQSKHSLAPVLRPYLQKLFVNSHELCWHLESIKQNDIQDELKALSVYCKLVNNKHITPGSGLIESVNKGWNWAKNVLYFVEKHKSLSLIFTPLRGKFYRHTLSLTTHEKRMDIENTLLKKFQQDSANNTLSQEFCSLWKKDTNSRKTYKNSLYLDLKGNSPLTMVIKQKYRLGNHRCFGDIIQSLISLNKISYLQEISCLLPSNDRQFLLNSIQKHSKDYKRYLTIRRRNMLPKSISNTSTESNNSTCQSYIPVEESAGIVDSKKDDIKDKPINETKMKDKSKDSLIENCRNVRILDDCKVIFTDNLKIRAICQLNNYD